MARQLTPKQIAFLCAYLRGGNATEAYKAAYDADGMSPGALKVEACRLLANERIAAKLAELRQEAATQAGGLMARLDAEVAPEPASAQAGDIAKQQDQQRKPDMEGEPGPEGENPNRGESTLTPTTLTTTQSGQNTLPTVRAAALNRAWVLARIMKNAQIALGEATVKLRVLPKGATEPIEVEVTQRDASAANKALEMLGKTPEVGLFNGEPLSDGNGTAEPLTPTGEWLQKVRAQTVITMEIERTAIVTAPWMIEASAVQVESAPAPDPSQQPWLPPLSQPKE